MISILLCFPETRYNRSLDTIATTETTVTQLPAIVNYEDRRKIEEATVEHVNTNTDTSVTRLPSPAKRTYRQELSLWSGRANHSFLNHLIRPFPLIAYPSVAWGTFTCKRCR